MRCTRVPSLAALAAALPLAFAAGCGRSGTIAIDETRTLAAPRQRVPPVADARARLLPAGPAAAFTRFSEMPKGDPESAPAAARESPYVWKVPEGWSEGPPRQLRLVTLVPKGRPDAECSVTTLTGNGGGLAANVNRWRQQVGVGPATDAEIAALTRINVLGRSSALVEVLEGARGVLGIVCETGAETVFVKMTGPAATLREERARFLEFCASLSRGAR